MRLSIPLDDASSDALRRLAYRELRPPQMQAKYLIEDALRSRGLLSEEQDSTDHRADHRAALTASP